MVIMPTVSSPDSAAAQEVDVAVEAVDSVEAEVVVDGEAAAVVLRLDVVAAAVPPPDVVAAAVPPPDVVVVVVVVSEVAGAAATTVAMMKARTRSTVRVRGLKRAVMMEKSSSTAEMRGLRRAVMMERSSSTAEMRALRRVAMKRRDRTLCRRCTTPCGDRRLLLLHNRAMVRLSRVKFTALKSCCFIQWP
jgi:hypothetical protein